MTKYYVYLLQSQLDKKFYIGCTANLTQRIEEHNAGKNKSTKHRRPLRIVYFEEFEDKHEAFKREFFLKSPKGFIKKKDIIENLKHSGVAQR